MDSKNIIIILIALVAVVLVACVGIFALGDGNNSSDDSNSIVANSSLNSDSNNSSNVNGSSGSDVNSGSSHVSSNDNSSEGVWKKNYQQGDGSYYKEVSDSNGDIRQYDTNGKLIGSTHDSDQQYLKDNYGSVE